MGKTKAKWLNRDVADPDHVGAETLPFDAVDSIKTKILTIYGGYNRLLEVEPGDSSLLARESVLWIDTETNTIRRKFKDGSGAVRYVDSSGTTLATDEEAAAMQSTFAPLTPANLDQPLALTLSEDHKMGAMRFCAFRLTITRDGGVLKHSISGQVKNGQTATYASACIASPVATLTATKAVTFENGLAIVDGDIILNTADVAAIAGDMLGRANCAFVNPTFGFVPLVTLTTASHTIGGVTAERVVLRLLNQTTAAIVEPSTMSEGATISIDFNGYLPGR